MAKHLGSQVNRNSSLNFVEELSCRVLLVIFVGSNFCGVNGSAYPHNITEFLAI